MRKISEPLRALLLAYVFLLFGTLVAMAHDCGSPGDCKVVPGNMNRATGLAGGVAVLVLVNMLLSGRRPESNETADETEDYGDLVDEDLLESAEEPAEEEVPEVDVSVSEEDILGEAPESPERSDSERPRRGPPPDRPLGE